MLIFITFLLLTSVISQETISVETNYNTRLPDIPEHLEYGRLDAYLINNTLPTFARSGLASEYVLFALDNYGKLSLIRIKLFLATLGIKVISSNRFMKTCLWLLVSL